ncbi:MAG: 3-oxoacyl-ACP reductase [Deltaproteobacteria bacterium]|nr:3-oxoacyl-ACP reductase [Deltaproteobacteria bacterium]
MSDYLVNLGRNGAARNVLGRIGVPLPQELRRAEGPYEETPLTDRTFVAHGAGLGLDLGAALTALGATAGPDGPDVIVLDASDAEGVDGLRTLYETLHPRIRTLARNGRIVVLGRPEKDAISVGHAVAQAALDGFVRSVAKELGRKGSTANLVRVAPGAEAHVLGALRFLLTDRSAYVSGQPLTLRGDLGAAPVFAPQPLHGKVALVTGAARGIGAATTRRLAAEGAKVLLLDREDASEALDAVATEVGGTVLYCDITAADAPERIARTLAEMGGADVVVHNAGITRDRTLGRMSDAEWDLVMQVNLGAILRVHGAMAAGSLNDGARIVLLSSTVGIAGNPGQTNYAATKAAMVGLSRRLAGDLAPRGIGVYAVAPGFIETRMTETIPFATREGARRLNSLSQGGLPQDVAEGITFLSTSLASGLSGGVLRVCGGSLIGA